jgi:hypothetical protein
MDWDARSNDSNRIREDINPCVNDLFVHSCFTASRMRISIVPRTVHPGPIAGQGRIRRMENRANEANAAKMAVDRGARVRRTNPILPRRRSTWRVDREKCDERRQRALRPARICANEATEPAGTGSARTKPRAARPVRDRRERTH